jgi:hypothetical protein
MKRRRAVAGAVAVLLLAGACSGDTSGEAAAPVGGGIAPSAVGDDDLTAAAERAAAYLADHLEEFDWANLAVADYLGRNWGLEELAGARELGRRVAGEGRAGVEWPALGRLFFADQPVPDAGARVDLANPALVAPLYCDRQPLTDGDVDALRAMLTDPGGYGATHAAIAVVWARELGCDSAALDQLATDAAAQIRGSLDAYLGAMQQLAEDQDRSLEDVGGELWISDLAMETVAILAYLGDSSLVAEWARFIVANQNPDGGFATPEFDQSASHWHPTLVALWVLLAAAGPGAGEPMVLASEPA